MNKWLDGRMAGLSRLMDSWLVRWIMASHTYEQLIKEGWFDGCMVL